jgi:di/tricarboxylate transporter
MPDPVLTSEMLIVFVLLGVAVLLFVFDWLRVDLVGILMMISLPLTGVLTGEEAIMGLSSNAVVSIIAVMIIGAGLNRTGIMNILAKKIIKIAGKGETRIMVVISATVSLISSFMQNIGAAALFLPATARISQQLRIPVSRILMPMGFCAIIGGCLTLIGSSPLIMLNDLMEAWWTNNSTGLNGKPFEPFGLFAVTPVGIALLSGGLLYFVLFSRFLLPKGSSDKDIGVVNATILEAYKDKVDKGFELTVSEDFPVMTVGQLQLRPKYLSTVIGIMKADSGLKNLEPTQDSEVGPGDILAVASTRTNIQRLAKELGWKISEGLNVFTEDISPANFAVLEGIIPPRSELSGHSMAELDFREMYQVNALAIYRENEVLLEDMGNIKLQVGDALLLAGPWEKFHLLKKNRNLIFTEELQGEETVPEKAGTAIFFLALSLVLAMGFNVKLSIALLTGAFGMILSRVIHIDEAYRAVDWMTIFLLAGLIPLGAAFEKTGAANYIAMKLLAGLGDLTPLVLMLTVAILTSMFSLVASNVGATVLMVPLAMNMGLQIGADPKMMALTVAVAASNTFILPTHQVNALVMRPGGYKTVDYMKAGFGMTFLYLIIQVGMLSLLSSG